MKVALFTIVFLLTTFSCFSQDKVDTLQIEKVGGSYVVKMYGEKLKNRHFKTLPNLTHEHEVLYDKANNALITSNVFGFIGGAALGWETAKFIRGDKASTPVLIVGAVSLIVALSTNSTYNKLIYKFAKQYNTDVKHKPKEDTSLLYFSTSKSGVGLTLAF